MSHYPPSVVRLIKRLARLPGVGEKTAERLAVHILAAPQAEAEKLAESLVAARRSTRTCSVCFGLADADPCHICASTRRDDSVLCVVERSSDMVAIEKSGAFSGRYHVLEGVLSPLDGMGPDQLRVRELFARIHQGVIAEVILATSTGVEGEATASYLAEQLSRKGIRTTRIAQGVPIGGDLKYIDGLTLKRALDLRRDL